MKLLALNKQTKTPQNEKPTTKPLEESFNNMLQCWKKYQLFFKHEIWGGIHFEFVTFSPKLKRRNSLQSGFLIGTIFGLDPIKYFCYYLELADYSAISTNQVAA